MTARGRNAHPLVELTRLPWWASVVAAALAYVALRWVAPLLAGARPLLGPLANGLAANAWWIAAAFLLPVPFSLYNSGRRRRLVDGRSNIDSIRALSWQDFELLVGEAYRRKGYRVMERDGAGADGGIDLELRTKDKRLVVQCKRWKTRTVGVELVRELYGVMAGEDAHGAIFVTSGRYTPDAIDFGRDKAINLLDGNGLVELLKGGQAGARKEPPGAPVVVTAEGPITCPQCGSVMVRRVAKQGASAGGAFWDCSRFPACRGTKSIVA